MVRTTVTPDNDHIELSIPEKYVGRKVEVLMYAIDEFDEPFEKNALLTEPKKPSEFGRILSDESVKRFDEYLKHSRDDR